MRILIILSIVSLMISCSNDNESLNNIKAIKSDIGSNINHISIAKNLLAPCIGEWSYNHSLITELKTWTLVISVNSYIFVCNLTDIDSTSISWAIENRFTGDFTKITCYCGNIGGTNSGKCMAMSDLTCEKVKNSPCDTDCTKKLEDVSNWSSTYGLDGLSILNLLELPILNVIYQ